MAKEGDLPPRDTGRAKATTPLEHGASTEILPVEIECEKPSNLAIYFIFSYNLLVFL